jgi:hypothetical protein
VSAGHSSGREARYLEALIYGIPRCDAPLLAVEDSASGRRLQLWLDHDGGLLPVRCGRLARCGRCPCRDLDRSPLGDRGRQSMRCAPPPCLTKTVGSKAGQGRDSIGGIGWLGCLRTCGPAVVLSECKATYPVIVSVSMLLLGFRHQLGIFARTHEIPPFLAKLILERQVKLRYHLHHIAPARYLPSWVDIAPLQHAT